MAFNSIIAGTSDKLLIGCTAESEVDHRLSGNASVTVGEIEGLSTISGAVFNPRAACLQLIHRTSLLYGTREFVAAP